MSDDQRSSAPTHPDELLAGLVDGTLTGPERAEVQAHLDGCERCRTDVARAESARRALRGLPEADAPWGLGRAAIEESRRGRREHRLRRLAPVAGVAAAAVLLVGLAFAVLRGPQGGGNAASQALGGTNGSAPAATPVQGESAHLIQRVSRNYDSAAIDHLAASYSSSQRFAPTISRPASPAPSEAPAGSSFAASSGPSTAPQPAVRVPLSNEDAVVSCIDSAAGLGGRTRPVRVIEARFEEKPALIGIYLSGPGADQPADLLVVWVASRQCQLLHYASHRITP
jgi:hypothetical protein